MLEVILATSKCIQSEVEYWPLYQYSHRHAQWFSIARNQELAILWHL